MKYCYPLLILLFLSSFRAKGADAVIIENKESFDIESIYHATYSHQLKIVINNEKGLKYAIQYLVYSPFISIQSFEATVREEGQDKIKKYKLNQLYDQSLAINGSTFYSDYRFKLFAPELLHFPAHIELSYKLNFKGFIAIPTWHPVPGYHVQVNHATYQISCPANYSFKTKALQFSEKPIQSMGAKKEQITTYEISNYPAIKEEPFSLAPNQYFPLVLFSPEQFYFDTHIGNTKTWADLGSFVEHLLITQNGHLSEPTKKEIHAIMESNADQKIALQKLYSFFQNRTRYVSIQLGIGGFKPMEPLLVDQNGYGDCKALSFYFKAILDEAKIPSNYSLIYGGAHPIGPFDDFPSMTAFNHAVLMCYVNSDTLLIECTSQVAKLGEISSFTANRRALLINEHESKLVRTPALANNYAHCITHIQLDSNHHASLSFVNQQNESYNYLNQLSFEEKKQTLKHNFRFEKTSLEHIQVDPSNPFKIEAKGKQRNYANGIGDIWMIPILPSALPIEIVETKRETPFQISDQYNGIDSIIIQLPSICQENEIPEDFSITNTFGTYTCKIRKHAQNELLVVREVRINSTSFAANEFGQFQEMLRKIKLYEKRKISLQVNAH